MQFDAEQGSNMQIETHKTDTASSSAVLSPERLRALLAYDPDDGTFRWLVAINRRIAPGTVTGSRNGRGYVQVKVDGRNYLAHRLAWFWMTGRWPIAQIDHEDGNQMNNRWTNLREASPSQNCANRGLPRNNRSGHKGVYWVATRGKWKAHIHVGGEYRYLGLFPTKEKAIEAYAHEAKAAFGAFVRALP